MGDIPGLLAAPAEAGPPGVPIVGVATEFGAEMTPMTGTLSLKFATLKMESNDENICFETSVISTYP